MTQYKDPSPSTPGQDSFLLYLCDFPSAYRDDSEMGRHGRRDGRGLRQRQKKQMMAKTRGTAFSPYQLVG